MAPLANNSLDLSRVADSENFIRADKHGLCSPTMVPPDSMNANFPDGCVFCALWFGRSRFLGLKLNESMAASAIIMAVPLGGIPLLIMGAFR